MLLIFNSQYYDCVPPPTHLIFCSHSLPTCFVCIHTYVRTCIQTLLRTLYNTNAYCARTSAYASVHTYFCVHAYIRTYVCMYFCVYRRYTLCKFLCLLIHTYVCMYRMYVCTYMIKCIFVLLQRNSIISTSS